MKLVVKFDTISVSLDWHKPLEKFPKVIQHNAKPYEWIWYGPGENDYIDYELLFGEIKEYDARFMSALLNAPDIIIMMHTSTKCDCGSESLKHPGHSSWCSQN